MAIDDDIHKQTCVKSQFSEISHRIKNLTSGSVNYYTILVILAAKNSGFNVINSFKTKYQARRKLISLSILLWIKTKVHYSTEILSPLDAWQQAYPRTPGHKKIGCYHSSPKYQPTTALQWYRHSVKEIMNNIIINNTILNGKLTIDNSQFTSQCHSTSNACSFRYDSQLQ